MIFMKKCVLLTAIIFALFVLSCAGQGAGGGTPTETAAGPAEMGTTAEAEIAPDLPDKNFGGYEFKVLNIDPDMFWCLSNIVVAEETGDTVDDAIYRRNLAVMEKYNVSFKYYPKVGFGAMAGMIKKANAAGEELYDVAFPYTREAASMGLDGQLCDIKTIPYIDNTKPWWVKKADDEMELGGRLFFGTNDIDLANLESCWTMEFNKTLLRQYDLENPYDLVASGKWTLDRFLEMSKATARDLDGDGKLGGMEDQYGFAALLAPGNGTFAAFIQSCGEYIVRKNADGIPEIAMGGERFGNVYTKLLDVFNNSAAGINANTVWKTDVSPVEILFTNDRALFIMDLLHYGRRLRDMKSDFGILPLPKYDEKQADYCTPLTYGATVFCVPISNADLERTGIIVEALAAESSRTVIPAYIDVALGMKYTRDEESLPMVKLILESRVYDMANFYNWANIMETLQQRMVANDPGIAAIYEKNRDKLQAAIDKAIEK